MPGERLVKLNNKSLIWIFVLLVCVVPAFGASAINISYDDYYVIQKDTYVNEGSGASNYGADSDYYVRDNTNMEMNAYFQLNFSAIGGRSTITGNMSLWTYTQAVLSASDVHFNVTTSTDVNWGETTLTWNNQYTDVTGQIITYNQYYPNPTASQYDRLELNTSIPTSSAISVAFITDQLEANNYMRGQTKEGTNKPIVQFNFNQDYEILYVEIYDEVSGDLINNLNCTARISANNSDDTITTQTGYGMFLNPGGEVSVNVDCAGSDYRARVFYIGELSGDETLNAYLINTSNSDVNEVTFTVKDGWSQALLSDALVSVSKIIDGSEATIYTGTTDIVGKFALYLEDDAQYTFNITRDGYQERVFDLYAIEETYTILLTPSESYDDYSEQLSQALQYSSGVITWSNTTKNITFTYAESIDVVNNFCMRIINRTNSSYPTQIYFNCDSSASGFMNYSVVTGEILYDIIGYANVSNYFIILDTYTLSTFVDKNMFFGEEGIVISVFIIITMALIGLISSGVMTMILSSGIGVLAVSWMGMMSIPPLGIVSLITLCIVMIIVMIRK